MTIWQRPEFVDDAWGDCWTCTLFRNEGPVLSSELITQAEAATAAEFGTAPEGGFLTFVDEDKVASSNPGYCFLKAGWQKVGRTKDRGLLVLHHDRLSIPAPEPALEFQMVLGEAA